jgi:hypothetical protein
VKDSAPRWKSSAPDLDKLCRAIGDVLEQSAILRNDALIVRWTATKEYGDPRVDLIITEADRAEVDLPDTYGDTYDDEYAGDMKPPHTMTTSASDIPGATE